MPSHLPVFHTNTCRFVARNWRGTSIVGGGTLVFLSFSFQVFLVECVWAHDEPNFIIQSVLYIVLIFFFYYHNFIMIFIYFWVSLEFSWEANCLTINHPCHLPLNCPLHWASSLWDTFVSWPPFHSLLVWVSSPTYSRELKRFAHFIVIIYIPGV